MRHLKTHSPWSYAATFLIRISGNGLAFLLNIVLARLSGAEQLGIYIFALTCFSIALAISQFGFDQFALRFTAIHGISRHSSQSSSVYRKLISLVSFNAVAIGSIAWLLIASLPHGFVPATYSVAIQVLLVALIPSAITAVNIETIKAQGKPVLSSYIQTVQQNLIFLLIIYAQFESPHLAPDAVNLSTAYVAASYLSSLITFTLWIRPKQPANETVVSATVKTIYVASLPLLGISLVNLAISWTDILILGTIVSPSEVAIYSVALKLSSLIGFVLVVANAVNAPMFAQHHSNGNWHQLREIALRSCGWTTLFSLIVLIAITLFVTPLLRMFGEPFVNGSMVSLILSIGFFVNVATGSVGYLLIMTGHQTIYWRICLFTIAANIIGNTLLIPRYGTIGAAVVTSTSLALQNTLAWFFVRHKLGINTLSYISSGIRNINPAKSKYNERK